jgi:5-methyltetrahydrofolate--homocysteine methyltransferase
MSAKRAKVVGPAPNIPKPPFWGVRVKNDFDLREIFQHINETALFKNQWQLKTASPEQYFRMLNEKFRPILQSSEDEVVEKAWYEPRVVYGYFPAQSEGNDVIVYTPDGLGKESLRFTFPRQREGRGLCIADYFLPTSSGQMDVIGLSLVTIGSRATEETQKMFRAGEFTRYLYHHGLSVETAEALAEVSHKHMREELGFAGDDAPRISDFFHQQYRGARYSFGYPACPRLEDQAKLFELLRPAENVGVQLTAGFLLEPEQSTSAIIVHHPEAKNFPV